MPVNQRRNWIKVKLPSFKHMSNRIKYEFAASNRTRNFLLFLWFFWKMNWTWHIQVMKMMNFVHLIRSIRIICLNFDCFTVPYKRKLNLRTRANFFRSQLIQLISNKNIEVRIEKLGVFQLQDIRSRVYPLFDEIFNFTRISFSFILILLIFLLSLE